jgi:hypothetical protein
MRPVEGVAVLGNSRGAVPLVPQPHFSFPLHPHRVVDGSRLPAGGGLVSGGTATTGQSTKPFQARLGLTTTAGRQLDRATTSQGPYDDDDDDDDGPDHGLDHELDHELVYG